MWNGEARDRGERRADESGAWAGATRSNGRCHPPVRETSTGGKEIGEEGWLKDTSLEIKV